MADDRDTTGQRLRVLFCIGVSQTFFDEEADRLPELIPVIEEAFADLGGRFGLEVLGTLDDDRTMVGPSPTGRPACRRAVGPGRRRATRWARRGRGSAAPHRSTRAAPSWPAR